MSSYQLALSLDSQIHSLRNPPTSLKKLRQKVAELFPDKLPTQWSFEYLDSEDEFVFIKDEDEYQSLISQDKEQKVPKRKLYIKADESNRKARRELDSREGSLRNDSHVTGLTSGYKRNRNDSEDDCNRDSEEEAPQLSRSDLDQTDLVDTDKEDEEEEIEWPKPVRRYTETFGRQNSSTTIEKAQINKKTSKNGNRDHNPSVPKSSNKSGSCGKEESDKGMEDVEEDGETSYYRVEGRKESLIRKKMDETLKDSINILKKEIQNVPNTVAKVVKDSSRLANKQSLDEQNKYGTKLDTVLQEIRSLKSSLTGVLEAVKGMDKNIQKLTEGQAQYGQELKSLKETQLKQGDKLKSLLLEKPKDSENQDKNKITGSTDSIKKAQVPTRPRKESFSDESLSSDEEKEQKNRDSRAVQVNREQRQKVNSTQNAALSRNNSAMFPPANKGPGALMNTTNSKSIPTKRFADVQNQNQNTVNYMVKVFTDMGTIPPVVYSNEIEIHKPIKVKNVGSVQWPSRCMIQNISGVKGSPREIESLRPDQEKSIPLALECPHEAGEFISIWELVYADGKGGFKKIGEPFVVDIEVKEARQSRQNQEQAAIGNNDESNLEDDFVGVLEESHAESEVDEITPEIRKKVKQIQDVCDWVTQNEVFEFVRKNPKMSVDTIIDRMGLFDKK